MSSLSETLLKLVGNVNLDSATLQAIFDKYGEACNAMNKHLNNPIIDKIKFLTIGNLVDDLKLAKQFSTYYSNWHKLNDNPDALVDAYQIKGFEVDGTCDLIRGGYNAEDRGVYVHFVHITVGKHSASITATSLPVAVLWQIMKTSECVLSDEEAYLRAFKAAKTTIENMTNDDEYSLDDYLQAITAYQADNDKYCKELKDIASNGFIDATARP